MAKKHEKILQLDAKICRLGKISNNLEKHGKEYVTAFTIPVSGLMLTKAELNRFMRDNSCHASWFDTTVKGAAQPMDWWQGEDFALSQSFEADALTIRVSGDRDLEFLAEDGPGDEDDDGDEDDGEESKRAACEISRITLKPQVGGLTEMRFALSLRPDIGKKNLMLQEHQHREVKITLVDGRVKAKRDRQPELPMGQHGADDPNTTPAQPPPESTLAH
jgi:hypothetical protein